MAEYIVNYEEEINIGKASEEDLLFFHACQKAIGTNETVTKKGEKFIVMEIVIDRKFPDLSVCKIRMVKV